MSIDVNAQFRERRREQMMASGARRSESGLWVGTRGWDAQEVIGKDGLDMTLGQAALYTASNEPEWHNLGNRIPGGISSVSDVLTLSGLDFEVVKVQSAYWWIDDFIEPEGEFHLVRSDTGTQVGRAGSIYEPIQNRDGFAFLQDLVDDDQVIWESAGALAGGKKVFISIRLPGSVIVDPDSIADEIIPFIAVINSHTGKGAFRCVVTPWRPVCGNTERLAVKDAFTSWTCKHTTNARGRVAEARETLRLSLRYFEKFTEEETALARTDMAIAEFDALIADLFDKDPEDEGKKKAPKENVLRRERLRGLFDTESERVGRTAYAAERAVTDYLDHVAPRRPGKTMTEELARAARLINGDDDKKKSEAHERLMALRTR